MKEEKRTMLITVILSFLCCLIMIYFISKLYIDYMEIAPTKRHYEKALMYFYNGGRLMYQDIKKDVEIIGRIIYTNGVEDIYSFPWGLMYVKCLTDEEYNMYTRPITQDESPGEYEEINLNNKLKKVLTNSEEFSKFNTYSLLWGQK